MIKRYPNLNAGSLRALSIVNIVLWLISTCLDAVIIARYSNNGQGKEKAGNSDIGTLDYIYAGLWAGLFYGVAGLIGIVGSYERKRKHLIAIVVMNVLSLVGAITAACIAGIIAFHIYLHSDEICLNTYPEALTDCMVWRDSEFSLMGFSVIAGIVNLAALIISLVGLCGLKKSNGLVRMEVGNPKSDHVRRPSA